MTAPDLARLYADVLRDPAAAAPRLAYADAVEATDPEHAELIRLQIALRARPPGAPWTREDSRELALRLAPKPAWTAAILAIPGVESVGLRGGFPDFATLTAAAFLAHGAALYATAPVLHVTLRDVRPVAAALFASPLLARLHSLTLFRADLGDDEVRLLAASAHLGELRWLDLAGNRITEAGIEALAASARLPRLRYVSLADNPAPDPTPQVTESDPQYASTVRVDVTAAGRALEARFGPRPWLSTCPPGGLPPDRDAF